MAKYKDLINYLSLPYLFIVSAMYHTGYWNQFDINILSYLSLTDAFNGIFLPLVNHTIPVVLLVSVLVLNIFFEDWFEKLFQPSLFKLANLKNLGLLLLGIALLILLLHKPILYLLNLSWLQKNWADYVNFFILLIVFVLAITTISHLIRKTKPRSPFFQNRIVALIIILLFPVYTLMAGVSNGINVKTKRYFYRIETTLLKEKTGFERHEYLIYLGKGGDTYFFTTPDFKEKLVADKSNFSNFVYTVHSEAKKDIPFEWLNKQ